MSAPLSKELRQKCNVAPCPFERMTRFRLSEDTTKARRLAGDTGVQEEICLHTEHREKARGTAVHMGVHPREEAVTRLKLSRDCKGPRKRKPSLHQQGRRRAEERPLTTFSEDCLSKTHWLWAAELVRGWGLKVLASQT